MFEMKPVSIGTKIVTVGKHRRVTTVVERYADSADIFYLCVDNRLRAADISHRTLMRAVDRGEVVLIGDREAEVAA